MASPSLAKQLLQSRALLVRMVEYRDSDAIVTLFTEQAGRIGALARGARRSKHRFPALEPLHLLAVTIELRTGRELGTLLDATMERPRIGLLSSLAAMQAAGQALRWLRGATAPKEAEPGLWLEINGLLDALDAHGSGAGEARGAARSTAGTLLGAFGLRLLAQAGWGLELGQCVRCGRPCLERSKVVVDVAAGGVVCRSCGGGQVPLSSAQRHALRAALEGDERALADPTDVAVAIALVDQTLAAHGAGMPG
jgi:DNA repair protein RecO (recombination protein O)